MMEDVFNLYSWKWQRWKESGEIMWVWEKHGERERVSRVFGLFNCFKRRIRTMSSHLETCPLSLNLFLCLSFCLFLSAFFPFFYIPLPTRIKKWHSEILTGETGDPGCLVCIACCPVFDSFPPLFPTWCTPRPPGGPYITQNLILLCQSCDLKLHIKFFLLKFLLVLKNDCASSFELMSFVLTNTHWARRTCPQVNPQ